MNKRCSLFLVLLVLSSFYSLAFGFAGFNRGSDPKTIDCERVSDPIDWDGVYEPGSLLGVVDHVDNLDHPIRIACLARDSFQQPDCSPFDGEKSGKEKNKMLVRYEIWSWKNGRWENALPPLVRWLPRRKMKFRATWQDDGEIQRFLIHTDEEPAEKGVCLAGRYEWILQDLGAPIPENRQTAPAQMLADPTDSPDWKSIYPPGLILDVIDPVPYPGTRVKIICLKMNENKKFDPSPLDSNKSMLIHFSFWSKRDGDWKYCFSMIPNTSLRQQKYLYTAKYADGNITVHVKNERGENPYPSWVRLKTDWDHIVRTWIFPRGKAPGAIR